MKIILSLAFLLALPVAAETEQWTKKDGETIQLELLKVITDGDTKVGIFQRQNGSKVAFLPEYFQEDDAKRLANWKPKAAIPRLAPKAPLAASVFDQILDGNLTILVGDQFKNHTLTTKPTKYYVFYYTASWCGPCQAFTPSLVEFYKKHKQGNNTFEFILISSDDGENAMLKYAVDKKMPWPHLKLSQGRAFEKKFKHDVRSIPSIIVCDIKGNVVSRDGRNLEALEKLVKKE